MENYTYNLGLYVYFFLLFLGALLLIKLSDSLVKSYNSPEDLYKLICAGIALIVGSVSFFYAVVLINEEVTKYVSQSQP